MKSTTITAAFAIDIFDDDWDPQTFPIQGLTPGLKREPSFPREFPTCLGRASPLPAAKTI
ncbi:MAG: hypothetical protein LBB26_00885 [Puniceicoccales bacterium]|jgi:hypothetical protein|nr:hypothetical protein [Puniceicoccales bacterium]